LSLPFLSAFSFPSSLLNLTPIGEPIHAPDVMNTRIVIDPLSTLFLSYFYVIFYITSRCVFLPCRLLLTASIGRVYKGVHIYLTKGVVAIKVLHRTYLGSEKERDNFLQEAQLLEMLKHLLPGCHPILSSNPRYPGFLALIS